MDCKYEGKIPFLYEINFNAIVVISKYFNFFLNFIYKTSLSITSANLTKKATVLGWLTKNSNKHNNKKKEL